MITIRQAKVIARHPQYYDSENLIHAEGLLHGRLELTKPIREELLGRARNTIKALGLEYQRLYPANHWDVVVSSTDGLSA